MATWGAQAEQVVAAVQRLCYLGLDAAELHRRAIVSLRRVVPFEGYCAHDADPASGLPMRQYVDPPDDQWGRFPIEQVVFDDQTNDLARKIHSQRPVALLSETTQGHLERSLRYRELLAPRGFGFDLRCLYSVDGVPWGGISALRERGRPDFTDREVTLMSQLAPHLAAGLRAAMLRTSASDASSARPGTGVLILDHQGRVVQHTPAAEHWLRQLRDLRPGWQEGRGLPGAVWSAVAQLHRTLHPQIEGDRLQVPHVRACTPAGEWIQLQAALAEARDGHSGDTIIVVEPLGPHEIAWLRRTAYGLSPREQEVVEWIARGVSTKQMAQSLCIAEYTVQDHLKHIFEKVGVHSRRELIQRLYLQHLQAGQ